MREAGIEFDWLTGSDITEAHWDKFFEFYMDTGGRKWGHPYLTREFFSRIGASMADQILLVFARRGRRTIAGALNFFGGGVLFGRNWGCTEYVPFLHFETCYYQAIEFAIARGLAKVEAGAQGAAQIAARLSCRRRPTARIISPIRACAAPSPIISRANAKRLPNRSRSWRNTAPFRRAEDVTRGETS